MAEILFYHLERSPLERVLPTLLTKVIERGWKAVVEVGGTERMEALDTSLWTYADESFLPHGLASDETAPRQPIVLANDTANPNGANVRFFVDRAVPEAAGDYERLVYLFDGHDPDAVAEARTAWKALADGNEVTYWQQDPSGRWQNKG
jgi:DNA polymerase-3 subunit chi